MNFTIILVLLFVGLIPGIFLWQKLYNPWKLCTKRYRVLPLGARECPWCGESRDLFSRAPDSGLVPR